MDSHTFRQLATREVQKMLRAVNKHNEGLIVPSLNDMRVLHCNGVFGEVAAEISFDFYDWQGNQRSYKIEYYIEVRIKGGRNYVYSVKIHLDGLDVFGGAADFDATLGRMLFEFEDDVRCAADRLQKRGTIASFKL